MDQCRPGKFGYVHFGTFTLPNLGAISRLLYILLKRVRRLQNSVPGSGTCPRISRGFLGQKKQTRDRALAWLPRGQAARATGMVQIYRAVPSGPNLNCAGRVAPEKLAAGMQRPREVQVPEHGCVRCGTAGEMGAGVPTKLRGICPSSWDNFKVVLDMNVCGLC